MEKLESAYSSRSKEKISKEFAALAHQLTTKVQSVGPIAVALELHNEPVLTPILHRLEAEALTKPDTTIAYYVGFLTTMIHWLDLLVEQRAVDAAEFQLSTGSHQANAVATSILKAAHTHTGVRSKDVLSVIATDAQLSPGAVRYHLKKLVRMKLVEPLKVSHHYVLYRITPLGEGVLARRLKPYELALFFIDEAAYDAGLRAAMKREMHMVWPDAAHSSARARRSPVSVAR